MRNIHPLKHGRTHAASARLLLRTHVVNTCSSNFSPATRITSRVDVQSNLISIILNPSRYPESVMYYFYTGAARTKRLTMKNLVSVPSILLLINRIDN